MNLIEKIKHAQDTIEYICSETICRLPDINYGGCAKFAILMARSLNLKGKCIKVTHQHCGHGLHVMVNTGCADLVIDADGICTFDPEGFYSVEDMTLEDLEDFCEYIVWNPDFDEEAGIPILNDIFKRHMREYALLSHKDRIEKYEYNLKHI